MVFTPPQAQCMLKWQGSFGHEVLYCFCFYFLWFFPMKFECTRKNNYGSGNVTEVDRACPYHFQDVSKVANYVLLQSLFQ